MTNSPPKYLLWVSCERLECRPEVSPVVDPHERRAGRLERPQRRRAAASHHAHTLLVRTARCLLPRRPRAPPRERRRPARRLRRDARPLTRRLGVRQGHHRLSRCSRVHHLVGAALELGSHQRCLGRRLRRRLRLLHHRPLRGSTTIPGAGVATLNDGNGAGLGGLEEPEGLGRVARGAQREDRVQQNLVRRHARRGSFTNRSYS